MPTSRKTLGTVVSLAIGIAVLGFSAPAAHAQYPNRAIKIVVPTTPGAVTDVLARVIGQGLSQAWGVSRSSSTIGPARTR
jgi:tripartite-type tricarboxylate transporter receptor subunit TctC